MDRPDDDADASEIAQWIEEDFGEALAEGVKAALEETPEDDASEE
jgi:hypothetical protein